MNMKDYLTKIIERKKDEAKELEAPPMLPNPSKRFAQSARP